MASDNHRVFSPRPIFRSGGLVLMLLCSAAASDAQAPPAVHRDVKTTPLYARMKTSLDAVRAIDTHDHLRSFDQIPDRVTTPQGDGMTLYSVWSHSYNARQRAQALSEAESNAVAVKVKRSGYNVAVRSNDPSVMHNARG